MGKVVSKVWHGIKSAGKWVGHTVEDGVHDVGTAAKDVGKLATHAVVGVGDALQHVVKFIPGVGGALADGIGGVTDLAKKADDGFNDFVNFNEHPLNTVKAAFNTIKDPHKLLKFAKKGLNTVEGVADDGLKIGEAVSSVDPELGGPELAAVLKAARGVKRATSMIKHGVQAVKDIKRGKLVKALGDAGSAIGGKYGKALKRTGAVIGKAKKVRSIVRKTLNSDGLYCDPDVDETLSTAFIPFSYEGPDAFMPLVNYLRGLHPDEAIFVHLFDAAARHLATLQFYPLLEYDD